MKQGEKDIYYVDGMDVIVYDGEGTVDRTHQTDLGAWRYAEKLYPILKDIIK